MPFMQFCSFTVVLIFKSLSEAVHTNDIYFLKSKLIMYINDWERGLNRMSRIKMFFLFLEILLIQLKLLIFCTWKI